MGLPADVSFLDQLLGPPHVQTSTATTATTYEPRALWQFLDLGAEDDPDANTLRLFARSGATAARPINQRMGAPFFDTTLGLPIWWNGTGWVKSDGTSA